MDKIIEKYLAGDLSPDEEKEFQLWLKDDPANQFEFENIVTHFRYTDKEIQQAKQKVLKQLMSGERRTIKQRLGSGLKQMIRIAAVLAIVYSSLFLFFENRYNRRVDEVVDNDRFIQIEKEAVLGQKLTFKLPDGSVVTLNAGSKLIYPKVFDGRFRRVALEGEAFFDVVPDKESPFSIDTKSLNIEVLGTSFNVRSYEEDHTETIGVKTGVVRVSTHEGERKVELQPSQLAHYSNQTHQISKDSILFSNAVFGWIDKELVFNEVSIDQVLKELTRWYGVQFEIVGELNKEQNLTSLYKNPTLISVLKSLSYVYNYKFEVNDKSVKITVLKNQ